MHLTTVHDFQHRVAIGVVTVLKIWSSKRTMVNRAETSSAEAPKQLQLVLMQFGLKRPLQLLHCCCNLAMHSLLNIT